MKKGCLLIAVAILSISSIGLGYYFYQQGKKNPIIYDVEKPTITTIINKTVATGSIKPRKAALIKPQVSGIIEELYIEAGDRVTKGQKIAKIKLIPNQVNINNAQNQLELAKIRFEESKRELTRQKQVYNKNLDTESIRSIYENAKKEEARNRVLFEQGVVSEQTYNRMERDLEMAKADLDNASIVAKNILLQFEADVSIKKQELNAAINNLQLLKEGVSKNSKQINNIIVATISGMVLEIPVEEGSSIIERNNFNEGTSIATIADMNALIFEGKVDESDVGKLKIGMPIELSIGAIDDKFFNATLEFIAPQGKIEEGTVKFEIRAAVNPNKEIFLRAGYSANGDIILNKRDQVIALRERDVIFSNDSTFIEVQIGNQVFEQRIVELGLSDGIQIEILNGVDTTTQVKIQKQI